MALSNDDEKKIDDHMKEFVKKNKDELKQALSLANTALSNQNMVEYLRYQSIVVDTTARLKNPSLFKKERDIARQTMQVLMEEKAKNLEDAKQLLRLRIN